MKTTSQTPSYPDLNGSEQHHDLKNQPGRKGDPDHAYSDEKLEGDAAEAVRGSDDKTQIADALRDVTKDA